MIEAFVYTGHASRVLFGSGSTAELASEIRALGCSRAMILTTIRQADRGRALLESVAPLAVTAYAGATMHTPVEVTEKALQTLRAHEADCLVALGGGSCTGLSKALALRTGLPQIIIPTTYAGSEVTPILGETRNASKVTQRSAAVLPHVVIYDVDHTLSLSPTLSISSGLNALAHAVEALYSRDANPVVSLMAAAGIEALAHSLPIIPGHPQDLTIRSDAQYGAWLSGMCLGAVTMALHHKLCHVLGGAFDLPHAQLHAILLPHSIAYNRHAAPTALARVAVSMGVPDPAATIFGWLRQFDLPVALETIGMPEDAIPHAVDLMMSQTYWNPRPVDADSLTRLLRNAVAGSTPGS